MECIQNYPGNISVWRLSNGMRIVTKHADSLVGYAGVCVNAGSRDDFEGCNGLAHFVEHTLFKGTRRRKSWHISNRMEAIGGELNAYTSKEETVLYTSAPAGHMARAVELLADIVAESVFPAREIEREREVVVEEINSYLDSPADAVYDEFEERIYAGSALAHNILGAPQNVRNLSGSDCRRFLDSFYVPSNMVAYAAGPEQPEKVARMFERWFGALHYEWEGNGRTVPQACEGFDEVLDHGRHQAHTVMGWRICGRNNPDRYALFLLNNYLGGPCMNSRFNQELRDKRGLVYTVDSSIALQSDCGVMAVYFGCEAGMVAKSRKLIMREVERVAQDGIGQRLFERMVNQYCGQLVVGGDNNENMAMSMAKSVLYYNEVRGMEAMTSHLRSVTAAQVRDAAYRLLETPAGILTML